ncbi:LemA family protein [Chlorogloeopsis sp. ULAP01]|uniref:LemA family protein n=1 Tax=Chlorogloeopsis sp. ULAP01 TaxID=3056483 RepID=UPI0025AA553D|nr:LemA family protein [Chlorogloeopsis sp. ULAP01]MDM9381930.1 LemA family protein [Chlorogloeopsis sp. ULAP01]
MISLYNGLVAKKNQVDNAFASIDVNLKKRSDLIPNLVAVAQNYMKYEESILTEITRLRSRAISGRANGNRNSAMDFENEISRALGNILISLEAYPELKADQYFLQLLQSLNEIEEQISAARRFYNSAVTDYNNSLEMFPTNLIASTMNYRSRRVFVATAEEKQNVDVKNLFEQ